MLVSSFPSYTRGGPMPLAGAPRDLYTQLLACSSSQSVVAIACCLRASLCFGFCLLTVSDCTMTTRWTNNSLAASSDRENLPSDTLLQAQLSVPSLPASAANSVRQSSSTVSAPVVAASVDDPALITVIVDAVKASLAAERGPGSTSSNLRRNSVSMELQAASGGIPAPSPSLSQQTANFLASGGAFPEQQAISLPSATQGTPNFTVPSFVATFTTPHSLTLRTSITAGVSVPVPLSDSSLVTSLPSGLLLQQPFVVGPGFSPIPVKTVSQIVAGKYVDSGELPSVNILQTKPESEAFLDVHLVFLPSTKKQRRRTEDIVTWSEAFTIFMLILTSYFPHCWKDLTSYKLLILCTYRQFSGRVEMAGIRSGLPPASCGDEARRLVDPTIFMLMGPVCILGLVVPWASYLNHLELAPPGSFASCGRGAAVWHSLLRVGLPIAAALVRVLTMRWNAQVVLTKHLCSIANADLLLLPPYLRPPRKAGVSGCALLFSWLFFLPCWSALIAFSFSPWFLTFSQLCYLIFVNSS